GAAVLGILVVAGHGLDALLEEAPGLVEPAVVVSEAGLSLTRLAVLVLVVAEREDGAGSLLYQRRCGGTVAGAVRLAVGAVQLPRWPGDVAGREHVRRDRERA